MLLNEDKEAEGGLNRYLKNLTTLTPCIYTVWIRGKYILPVWVETEGKGVRAKNNKTANLEKRRTNMNEDILKGKWKEIKGEVKQKWGKLTDDDLAQVEGKEEQLLGLLQKRNGYAK